MRSLALISKQGSVSSLFLPGGIPLTFSRSLFEPRSFVVRYRTRVCESSLTLNTASHPDKPVHGEGIYIPCFIFIKGQLWHFGTRPHISRVWRAVNTVRQLGTNSFSKAKIISCLFFFFFFLPTAWREVKVGFWWEQKEKKVSILLLCLSLVLQILTEKADAFSLDRRMCE